MILILMGFGLDKRAGRGALKLLKRSARLQWRLVSERRMRPDGVVQLNARTPTLPTGARFFIHGIPGPADRSMSIL